MQKEKTYESAEDVERPILFSAPMVRAILEGRKTQTRRIIKLRDFEPRDNNPNPNVWDFRDRRGCWNTYHTSDLIADKCPYGQPGDRLYVKETHYRFGMWVKNGLTKSGKQKWKFKEYNREVCFPDAPSEGILTDRDRECLGWFKRPSLFMPRWASRILLEIVSVRVERLCDISETDAAAEGVEKEPYNHIFAYTWIKPFRRLWESISGTGSWDANPWVWVVEFKRVEGAK